MKSPVHLLKNFPPPQVRVAEAARSCSLAACPMIQPPPSWPSVSRARGRRTAPWWRRP